MALWFRKGKSYKQGPAAAVRHVPKRPGAWDAGRSTELAQTDEAEASIDHSTEQADTTGSLAAAQGGEAESVVHAAGENSSGAVARRSIVAGALLAMVLLGMFGVESQSSGAVTVPSVSVPSVSVPPVQVPPVHIPPVNVPSISTPAGNTPPVSTRAVSGPSVSVPPVGSTPSLSVAGGQGASGSSSFPSTASANAAPGAGQSGAGTSSIASPVGGGHSAGARDGRAPSSAGSDAARQRHLRSLVVRLSRCLSTLPPQAQHVLLLRAGIGTARPDSSNAVAHIMHISRMREARVEHAALAGLQAAARDGRCGSTPALIQVPAQDRLVPVDAVLMNQSQPPGSTQASGHAIGAFDSKRTRDSRHGGPAIEYAAMGELPTSSSPAGPWVFGALVLLGGLALLSAMGRRLGDRQRLAISASAIVLPVIAPASRAALEPNDATAEAAAANEATAGKAPGFATSNNTIVPEVTPPVSSAAAESSEPGVTPAPTLAPRQAAPLQVAPRQAWLRTHRSQIALVLTVAAGGAVRLMARDRGRRRH